MSSESSKPVSSNESWIPPLPIIDSDSQAYWEAARQGYLGLPRCKPNGHYFFYPRSICPVCYTSEIELVRASGKGTIYSFTVVHRHPNPAFNALAPYIVALIDLAEGPRMLAAVRNQPSEVKIGSVVEAIFEEQTPEITLPCFKLQYE